MKLAKGSVSWIISSSIICVIFLALFLIFEKESIAIFFITFFLIFLLITIFFVYFFRDPDRTIGKGLVSSADGRIREITDYTDEDIGKCVKISTFMNVNNVHVNRCPYEGVVKQLVHKKGSHIPAYKKESERNERVIILLDTNIGKIKIIQIAGLIARRIVSYVKPGDRLKKGDKIGIIRLGSRVDLFIPKSKIKKITIQKGCKVIAGEDTVATLND